jgi:hypothetical protein
MAEAVMLSRSQYLGLVGRLDRLEEVVVRLVAKLERAMVSSKYGSAQWWLESIRQSEQDYQEGNFVVFDSAEKTKRYLDSLK